MKRAVLWLAIGILVGQLDPIGWAAWRLIEARLPRIRSESLAGVSPFEQLPRSRWIAESPNAFVIEDLYAPTAPVHLLVVPKQRFTSILEPPPQILGEMLDLARRAARERGIAESGFRIVVNTNPEGGQTVYHLHVHVKGGRQLTQPMLPVLWGRLSQLGRAS